MSLTREAGLLVSTKVNRTVLWVGLYSGDFSLWQADIKVNHNIGLSATKLPLQSLRFHKIWDWSINIKKFSLLPLHTSSLFVFSSLRMGARYEVVMVAISSV